MMSEDRQLSGLRAYNLSPSSRRSKLMRWAMRPQNRSPEPCPIIKTARIQSGKSPISCVAHIGHRSMSGSCFHHCVTAFRLRACINED